MILGRNAAMRKMLQLAEAQRIDSRHGAKSLLLGRHKKQKAKKWPKVVSIRKRSL